MLIAEIRSKFLEYFKSKGHTLVASSPVVPLDDPTLLFTNAGMNQFKDVFLGKSKRPYTQAASSQKCIRVGGKHNDLDNVGHTTRHMTFFEMLGNFSFGDYFKKEAIDFAWDVATEIFEFDKTKIYASVFQEDDEAYALWSQILPQDRILKLGEKDNYWQMGDTGPCGPCSELLFDRGPAFEGDERYLEFWNLVFMQFNQEGPNQKSVLPRPSIDTGAGLERVAMLKKGVNTVFETDILRSLIAEVENLSQIKYAHQPAFHVISDHLRALAFAISDGAQPSNLDRGYVLRKLLRRAVRYGRLLGFEKPFLARLLPRLIDTMGHEYRELKSSENRIAELLTIEEESFLKTLKRGGNLLNSIIESSSHSISGDDAFKLKDTYGFPLEEILLIAKDANLTVNIEQYGLLEEEAKERSRAARKGAHDKVETNLFENFEKTHGTSEFTGYTSIEEEGTIIGLIVNNQFVESMDSGTQGLIILNRTPFYAEKGGQVGDTGTLTHQTALFTVEDTKAPFPGITAHIGTLEKGFLMLGEPLLAQVNKARRSSIANNHTAAHLLHFALQEVLGPHIRQAGSLVDWDHLRFDFHHHKSITEEELLAIEKLVNDKIEQQHEITTEELPLTEVQKNPAIKQFFGDKYGEVVRLVAVSSFSQELCGGTHATSTSEIRLFRITKESSIAKGVRRIEAITGSFAIDLMYHEKKRLLQLAEKLETPLPKLEEALEHLQAECKEAKEKVRIFQKEALDHLKQKLAREVQVIRGKSVITAKLSLDPAELPPLAAHLGTVLKSGIVFLTSISGGRCHLFIRVSDDLIQEGIHANTLIKELAPLIQGGGGGKKDTAQAGGTHLQGIDHAISSFLSSL
ncbi:MAG: alanine--tRNA ligase [Simkaniaceae bacterium]|nr:alanine--tRNA ligase [Simkaniaceae bacterium]